MEESVSSARGASQEMKEPLFRSGHWAGIDHAGWRDGSMVLLLESPATAPT